MAKKKLPSIAEQVEAQDRHPSGVIAARKFWSPRNPVLPEMCASCPFREGNDAEFGAVVKRLAAAHGRLDGRPVKVTKATVARARHRVKEGASRSGEFACHHTAYDSTPDMQPTPERRMQCAGAYEYYRSGKKP